MSNFGIHGRIVSHDETPCPSIISSTNHEMLPETDQQYTEEHYSDCESTVIEFVKVDGSDSIVYDTEIDTEIHELESDLMSPFELEDVPELPGNSSPKSNITKGNRLKQLRSKEQNRNSKQNYQTKASTCKQVCIPMNDQQTLLFISAVRNHQCLWNHRLKSYKDRECRKKAWQEIANSYGGRFRVPELKYKWSSLRGSFRHYVSLEKMKNNEGSAVSDTYNVKWPFYEKMTFVKCRMDEEDSRKDSDKHNTINQKSKPIPEQKDVKDAPIEEDDVTDDPELAPSSDNRKRKRNAADMELPCSALRKILDISVRCSNHKDDEDVLYVTGLCEKLRKFSPTTKQIMKCRIDQMVNDQIMKDLKKKHFS